MLRLNLFYDFVSTKKRELIMERVDVIVAIMQAVQSIVVGSAALIIMIIFMQRKGKWALLMMPMILYSFLWSSWHHVRYVVFVVDIVAEFPPARYVYFGAMMFMWTTCLLVAFIPCVMKDKEPEQIEP